jgi:hypothetical protein
MLKHFLQNNERFYQLIDHAPVDLDVFSWNDLQNQVRVLTGSHVGNWSDDQIRKLVKELRKDDHADLRSALLEGFDQYYRVIAESIVNEVCGESESTKIEVDSKTGLYYSEFCMEGLSENDYGAEPVRSDLYFSKEGIVVVLKPAAERPSLFYSERCRELRTVYRLNKYFTEERDFERKKTIQSFKDRSLTLLKQDD